MMSPSRDIFGAEFNGTPSHHRVLKPPGGGSSDIFGTGGQPQEPEPTTPVRRVKNYQQSNLFLNDEGSGQQQATPRNTGKDSFSTLFGPPPSTPQSVTKNRMKSNICLSHEDEANSNTVRPGSAGGSSPGSISPVSEASSSERQMNGGGENGHSETDGTGSMNGSVGGGNKPMTNGNANPTVNGNPAPQPNQVQRNRVPPGGYSSGLW